MPCLLQEYFIIIFINKSSIEKHAIKYIRNLGIDYSINSQKQIRQIQVIGDGREWERIVSIHGTFENLMKFSTLVKKDILQLYLCKEVSAVSFVTLKSLHSIIASTIK